jgi:hypothetical protein
MIFKKIVFGICFLSFFVACVPKTEEKPVEIVIEMAEKNPAQISIELIEENPFEVFNDLTIENPSEMFKELCEIYFQTKFKDVTISQNGEGAGMLIFDIYNEISEDIFCQIITLSSMGQTQYFVYKKNDEGIWYFQRKAYFYDGPFEIENAEIQNTYFIYINDLPFSFNEENGKYDNQADINKFLAVTDFRSLSSLIEIIEEYIQ